MFFRGFEKRAIDLPDARKATNALKPSLIRRDARIGADGLTFSDGMSVGPIARAPTPKHPALAASTKALNRAPVGTIFAKGDMSKLINNHPIMQDTLKLPQLNPENKEMFNRSMLLHEGLERNTLKKQKTFSSWKTHANPEVILKENNIIASMPDKFQPVKDFYGKVRNLDTTRPVLEKALPGFQYGKQRYSRHAIKRLSEILKQKGVVAATEQDILKGLGMAPIEKKAPKLLERVAEKIKSSAGLKKLLRKAL
jgi:hypothetical protein